MSDGAWLPRLQSPYGPETHYTMKRQLQQSGYKVHITET
jgi:transposase